MRIATEKQRGEDRFAPFAGRGNRRRAPWGAIIVAALLLLYMSLSSVMGQQKKSPPQSPRKLPNLTMPKHAPILVQYPPPEIEVPYSVEQLQARLRHQPSDFVAHFYLMCLYAQQGQWQLSLRHALRARQIDNSDINVHLGIAYGYAHLGRDKQAEEALQAALQLPFNREDRSALWRVRGDVATDRFVRTGQSSWLTQARFAYQQALQLDASNIQAMVGLARIAIAYRNYTAAQRQLQKALIQVDLGAPGGHRKKALVIYYLGVIEELRGRMSQAKRLYQEARQLHPPSFLSMTHGELLGFIAVAAEAFKVSNGQQTVRKKGHIKTIPQKNR